MRYEKNKKKINWTDAALIIAFIGVLLLVAFTVKTVKADNNIFVDTSKYQQKQFIYEIHPGDGSHAVYEAACNKSSATKDALDEKSFSLLLKRLNDFDLDIQLNSGDLITVPYFVETNTTNAGTAKVIF